MNSSAEWLQSTTTDTDTCLQSTTATDNDTITNINVHNIGFNLYFYALSLLLFPVGVVCNVFTVCIFITSKSFRSTSTAQFLIALSITDCQVLLGDALRCLAMPNVYDNFHSSFTFINTNDVACKLVYYWRQRYLFTFYFILFYFILFIYFLDSDHKGSIFRQNTNTHKIYTRSRVRIIKAANTANKHTHRK